MTFYFSREQIKSNNLIKKSRAETFKNVEMDKLLESDEELPNAELENAVKNYKKNKCKLSETEYVATENNKINKSQSFYSENIDDNDNDSGDLLELINYFRKEKISQNKKPVTKSYSDYERQGAIPKHKARNGSSMIVQPKTSKTNSEKKIRNKKNQKESKINLGNNEAKNNSFCVGLKNSKSESSLYTFINSNNSNDVIVKINNEICSAPFFYVVPSTPSPNFFFSPGSYFITPKIPNFLQEEIIIFHPESKASTSCELGDNLKVEEKLSQVTTKCTGFSCEPLGFCMNDLGKEVDRKEDSHLNIGPLDAKLNESAINLETSCSQNKTYEKSLLNLANFNDSNVIKKRKSKKRLQNKTNKTDFQTDGVDLAKDANEIKILNTVFLKKDKKNLHENNGESDTKKKGEIQQTDLKPTVEFLDSDTFSVLNENSSDGEKLLTLEAKRQLEKMSLALPEIQIEELQEKLIEFQGNENLIDEYIEETRLVLRIRQGVLDMLLIFPDADPDFLYQEIEKLTTGDNMYGESAINYLTEQLLESEDYPKISQDNLNSEKRILWQKYVQNFTVKDFILTVSNPQDFGGPNGDDNKANIELILKFLMSRYPSQSRDFLQNSFELNSNNLTKTCEALNSLEVVRLSESFFKHEAFDEALMKEICYIDHREEIDNYLREMEERKNLEIEEACLNNTFLSCPLCAEVELVVSEVIPCPEGHIFCKECIKRYVLIKLGDGIYRFRCPTDECDAFFSHTVLEQLLSKSVFLNIIKKQQVEEVSNAKLDGLEFCPSCDFAYIPVPEDKIFICQNPECLRETCRECREINHIPLRCKEVERSIDVEVRKKIEEAMTEELVRSCPKCWRKFVKVDGCNKMICCCGTMVCYFCRKEIQGYDHFKGRSFKGVCPLYSDNQVLHTRNVLEAGIQARNQILQNNPDIHIVHDPTIN